MRRGRYAENGSSEGRRTHIVLAVKQAVQLPQGVQIRPRALSFSLLPGAGDSTVFILRREGSGGGVRCSGGVEPLPGVLIPPSHVYATGRFPAVARLRDENNTDWRLGMDMGITLTAVRQVSLSLSLSSV